MRPVWAKVRAPSSFGQHGATPLLFLTLELTFTSSVPTGRVIFEIGGSPIREELAREGKRPA